MKNFIILISIVCVGWLIALGVGAVDGVRQVVGGTDTVGSIGLANLPSGVLTNLDTRGWTNASSGSFGLMVSNNTAALLLVCGGNNNTISLRLASAPGTDKWVHYINGNNYYFYDATAANHNALSFISGTGVALGKTTATADLDVVVAVTTSLVNSAGSGFASYARNLLAPVAITVGASPFSWTNSSASSGGGTNIVEVYIDGVSVTGTVAINGTTIFSTIGQNTIRLQPGEYTTITYTIGTPTATFKNF